MSDKKHDWPALLADAKKRGVGITALARELGHANGGFVSRMNAKNGYPINPKLSKSGPRMRFEHRPAFNCPNTWGLTLQQAQLVAVLVDADEPISPRDLLSKMTGSQTDPKILDVVICKARKKLRKFNVEIHRIWGKGVFIPGEMKIELRAGKSQLARRRSPIPATERAA